MAVTFVKEEHTSSTSAETSLTIAGFNVPAGENRILVAIIGLEGGNTGCTSVTYGTWDLTYQVNGDEGSSSGERVEIWTLVNPPVGDADLVANFPSEDPSYLAGMVYTGVDQNTPIGVKDGDYATTGSDVTITVTTQYVNSVLVAGGEGHGGDTYPGSTSYNERYDYQTGTSTISDAGCYGLDRSVTSIGSYTINYTQNTSDNWAIAVIELVPVQGPTITNIDDEDFYVGEEDLRAEGLNFNTIPGTIAIANGTIWASADKNTLVWSSWTDTDIYIQSLEIGTLTPGTLWIYVADYEGNVSSPFEVFVWIRPVITAMGEGDELFTDGETGIDILGTDFGLETGSATIVLGDASVYESCGTLDPQVVTSWSNTLITFTAVRTSLDVEDCWVYVIEEDGHPSNGWPVVMLRKDAFEMSPSGNLTDKEVTTSQLTSPGGVFQAGQALDISNPGGPINLIKSRYTEFEWCLKALTDAINGAQYEFRATDDGREFYLYIKIAKVTLA